MNLAPQRPPGWNAAGGQDPNAQTDPDWLTAADDPVEGRWNFWADGNIDNVLDVRPGDMLDPANLDPARFPHSYVFDNLPTTPAPRQAGRAIVARSLPRLAAAAAPQPEAAAAPQSAPEPQASSEEIASHKEPVEVGHEPVSRRISLRDAAPALLGALDERAETEPARVILRLDGIVTKNPPGNYEVYLNNTEVGRSTAGAVAHFVGLFSAFGASHSHGGHDHEHHAHGVSASYDITDLVAYLREQGEWDESSVTVTFVLAVRPTGDEKPVVAPVTIGSIRVITE